MLGDAVLLGICSRCWGDAVLLGVCSLMLGDAACTEGQVWDGTCTVAQCIQVTTSPEQCLHVYCCRWCSRYSSHYRVSKGLTL